MIALHYNHSGQPRTTRNTRTQFHQTFSAYSAYSAVCKLTSLRTGSSAGLQATALRQAGCLPPQKCVAGLHLKPLTADVPAAKRHKRHRTPRLPLPYDHSGQPRTTRNTRTQFHQTLSAYSAYSAVLKFSSLRSVTSAGLPVLRSMCDCGGWTRAGNMPGVIGSG
jgi:hypothetical protein